MSPSRIIKFTKKNSDIANLVGVLKLGEVVAAPTETAYGLLTVALDKKAVNKIYKIKGRESGKPCPVIISDLKTAQKYFYFSKVELILAKKFWPGPLTLILKPRQGIWPKQVANKQGEVGVRVPGSLWLRKILMEVKLPLTATSANLAGEPTLFSCQEVINALAKRNLKFIVLANKLKARVTSTVIKLVNNKPIIYRSGAVSSNKINRSLR